MPGPARAARPAGTPSSVAVWFERLKPWGAATVGVASVVGAVAAVLVFFVPSADSPPSGPTGSTPATSTGPASSTPASSTPAASSTPPPSSDGSRRRLATMTPEVGAGLVTVSGDSLELACPSNQSDDTSDEITYALTARFTALEGKVELVGQAGPDDAVGVQTYIQYREERTDRRARVGVSVAKAGQTARLAAPLTDAAKVSLVVTCSNPRNRVRILSPALLS